MQRRGSPRSQQLWRTKCSERSSSEGVLDAVCGEATVTTEQLGASSSDERQDLQQGLAMGIREWRPWTWRQTCLMRPAPAREQKKDSISNTRLHQTRRPVNQCWRVCVERCPLTMRHVATRSGGTCGSESTRRKLP